jgi:hypothetical protein
MVDVGTEIQLDVSTQTSHMVDAGTKIDFEVSTQTAHEAATPEKLVSAVPTEESIPSEPAEAVAPTVPAEAVGPAERAEAAFQTEPFEIFTAPVKTSEDFQSTQTKVLDVKGTQTNIPKMSSAGRMPPITKRENGFLEVARLSEEHVPVPPVRVGRWPPDSVAPALAEASRHLAAGRLGAGLRSVFTRGNEHTLRGVLQQLDPSSAWVALAEAEARYLSHLLVGLFCKDPAR